MLFERKPKIFLTPEEIQVVMQCIRAQEQKTSGEIRLCIESRCVYMDPVLRAKELFYLLKMYETTDRNAALIYIAHQDKDFALFADGALFEQVEVSFWHKASIQLGASFYNKEYVEGLTTCITQVGAELGRYFPWEGEKKNELPDEIIFGK